MNNSMIEVTPLSSFGAEIIGVDLGQPQDPQTIARIRKTWMRHGVIVFREQPELHEKDLVRFSRYFGELEVHIRKEYLSPENPEVLYVSNKTDDGRNIGILASHEVGWHHDQIYLPKPALGSLLYGFEIPASGGNTEFINLADAYEALDEDLKAELTDLRGVQSYAFFNGQWSEPTNASQTARTADIDHPLIRTHPETGRKAIYADPGMTPSIKDIAPNESRRLLDKIFDHSISDAFRYSHVWRRGDAVMWDNAATMHRRGEFNAAASRLMKRTTILPPAESAVPF